jgi:hypothetical protein
LAITLNRKGFAAMSQHQSITQPQAAGPILVLTAGYLRGETSHLRQYPGDQYGFALSSSDALAAITLDFYASQLQNFVQDKHPEIGIIHATARALRDWPEKKIPGLAEHGTAFRYGLTTLDILINDDKSLLNRLPSTAPAYVITYDPTVPHPMLLQLAACQAIHFWSFHAEIQNVPAAKVISAATLAQAMFFYGTVSKTPPDQREILEKTAPDLPAVEE